MMLFLFAFQFGLSLISPDFVCNDTEEFVKSKMMSQMISEITKRLGYESDLSLGELSFLFYV